MVQHNVSECPYCHSTMVLSKAPFLYHGSYIGLFEAYICNNCKRIYFTEKSYKEIMAVPISLEDFLPFEEEPAELSTLMLRLPSLLEVKMQSDSSTNKVYKNEEELTI